MYSQSMSPRQLITFPFENSPNIMNRLFSIRLCRALDKKYDTLREKILKAALIKKVGEEKWDEMS